MSEKENLTAFTRVLRYVWPQWPSLIALFLWAALISLMFSASFLTIIPLLKVMMEEEGLHCWVDRKMCNGRYGMDFYVPSLSDFNDDSTDLTQYLLINRIDKGGKEGHWAEQAQLHTGDLIVAVDGDGQLGAASSPARMLEVLATCAAETPITLSIRRTTAQGDTELLSISKPTPPKPFYADLAQWPVSFIPRDGTKENVFHAMVLVIVGLTIITILRCWAKFNQSYLAEKS